jgi:hypothetical protein
MQRQISDRKFVLILGVELFFFSHIVVCLLPIAAGTVSFTSIQIKRLALFVADICIW